MTESEAIVIALMEDIHNVVQGPDGESGKLRAGTGTCGKGNFLGGNATPQPWSRDPRRNEIVHGCAAHPDDVNTMSIRYKGLIYGSLGGEYDLSTPLKRLRSRND